MTTWRDRFRTLSTDTCDKDILDDLRQSDGSAPKTSENVENVRVTRVQNQALAEAITESLSLHAECLDRLGTDLPETLPQIVPALRDKIIRQRKRVNATLTGVDPSVHIKHIESLNAGLKLILNKLAPRPPEPPKPPMPNGTIPTSAGSS